jgi:hypothetical protein
MIFFLYSKHQIIKNNSSSDNHNYYGKHALRLTHPVTSPKNTAFSSHSSMPMGVVACEGG